MVETVVSVRLLAKSRVESAMLLVAAVGVVLVLVVLCVVLASKDLASCKTVVNVGLI